MFGQEYNLPNILQPSFWLKFLLVVVADVKGLSISLVLELNKIVSDLFSEVQKFPNHIFFALIAYGAKKFLRSI